MVSNTSALWIVDVWLCADGCLPFAFSTSDSTWYMCSELAWSF